MKVLWLTNIPSPYRVKFFNALGKHCDLTVLFENRTSSERDASWGDINTENFHAVFLKGKRIGVAEAFCPSVIRYLTKPYDRIVITNYSDPTGMLAVAFMKARRIRYEIEGDGAFPGTGKGIKEWLKKFLLSGASRYFSTAKLHDSYYRMYGAAEDQIVRYPFTSVREADILAEPMSGEQKKSIRKTLQIEEKYMVLAVGQFIHRKGYDVLLKAAADLPGDFGVYIIGGQAADEYIGMVQELGLNNIHFSGFKKPEELSRYYEAADVFVHPTREDIWGLVVNEAMAKALPVVTTDRCIAGLEMVEDGVSGRIVPVEDEKALSTAITQCTFAGREMSAAALKKAREYTTERMALCHVEAWERC